MMARCRTRSKRVRIFLLARKRSILPPLVRDATFKRAKWGMQTFTTLLKSSPTRMIETKTLDA